MAVLNRLFACLALFLERTRFGGAVNIRLLVFGFVHCVGWTEALFWGGLTVSIPIFIHIQIPMDWNGDFECV